ncbi:putative protein kinase RLK-Pelle-DLSV family [Helianthus annuus]|nr:putative protein kinase RLK-Pelle-DLSV family [Helianthus annuus]
MSFRRINGATPMLILMGNGQVIDGDSSLGVSPEFCYGYDSGNGCVADSNLPQCRSRGDQFLLKGWEFTSGTYNLSEVGNSSLSISDCMERCWNDCHCLAFNYGVGCNIWRESKSANVFINPLETSVDRKYVLVSTSKCNIIVIHSVVCRKREQEERQKNEDRHLLELMASENSNNLCDAERGGRNGGAMVVFSIAAIVTATNNFSDENKLGKGGFGPVYKGKLSDGREVAIKRLSRTSRQGLVEFKNELILIAKLQHTNLVRVLGCCIHGEEKMLILNETRKALLDWPKRWNIVEGIAQGLLYLHKYSRMQVIHRDLKASNVLLDESMNPKISDFGLARIFKQDETEAITKRVVGTYGYMSPEYAMDGTFSVKSDVFSFGVLVLEIVSGRRNACFSHLDKTVNLIGYAWELWQQGDAMQLQDPTLADSCVEHQWLRTIHVASGGTRPSTQGYPKIF